MPQIWLSCEELATILDIDAETVRRQAAASRREVRRGRDGITRILLSETMAREYIRIQVEAHLAEHPPVVAATPVPAAPLVATVPTVTSPVEPVILLDRPLMPKPAPKRARPVIGTAAQIVTLWDRCRNGLAIRGGLAQGRSSAAA